MVWLTTCFNSDSENKLGKYNTRSIQLQAYLFYLKIRVKTRRSHIIMLYFLEILETALSLIRNKTLDLKTVAYILIYYMLQELPANSTY